MTTPKLDWKSGEWLKGMGLSGSQADYILETVGHLLTQQKEDQIKKVGMLRQWINEERIKDPDKFVTNEQLLEWLK
jgi:hypothetical protein